MLADTNSKPALKLPIFLSLVCLLNILLLLTFWQPIYYIADLADAVYRARDLYNGLIPYRDFFHNHFTGYLIPFAIFGSLIGFSPILVAVVQAFYQCIYTVFLALTYRALSKNEEQTKWCALLAATAGWFTNIGGTIFNCQSYILPFLAVFFYAAAKALGGNKNFLYLAALAYSLVATFDQRVLFFYPVIFVPFIFISAYRDKIIVLKTLVFSSLIPVIGVILLAACAALPEFIEQSILFQFKHRNAGLSPSFLERFEFFIKIFKEPVGVISLLAVYFLFSNKIQKQSKIYCLLLLFAGVLAAFAGGRLYPHYLLFLSPYIILSATFASANQNSRKSVQILVGLVFIAISLHSVWSLYRLGIIHKRISQSAVADVIPKLIKQYSQPSDEVLVWGYCPQLYLHSERYTTYNDMGLSTIASSVFHLSPLNKDNIVPELFDEFKRYLDKSPPKMVLARVPDNRPSLTTYYNECIFGRSDLESQAGLGFFRKYLDEGYHLLGKVDDGAISIGIYIRN